jgi:hypothetical protein
LQLGGWKDVTKAGLIIFLHPGIKIKERLNDPFIKQIP